MNTSEAALLTALLVVLLLVIAWRARSGKKAAQTSPNGFRNSAQPRAGPNNLGLYDRPYEDYPYYEGRAETAWDGDRRCVAYCGQSPCTIWCR